MLPLQSQKKGVKKKESRKRFLVLENEKLDDVRVVQNIYSEP